MLNLYNRDFPCLTLTLHSTQREDVLRRFLAGKNVLSQPSEVLPGESNQQSASLGSYQLQRTALAGAFLGCC